MIYEPLKKFKVSDVCSLWDTGKYFKQVLLEVPCDYFGSTCEIYDGLVGRVSCEEKKYSITLTPEELQIFERTSESYELVCKVTIEEILHIFRNKQILKSTKGGCNE